ncbi:hypothetical protein EDB80DRAFT_212153 [Ilyonectria destructans]|nr:hypothetical protein EDB80DRAFT_212153 [Ilyonectria destructans]
MRPGLTHHRARFDPSFVGPRRTSLLLSLLCGSIAAVQVKPARRLDIATRITQPSFVQVTWRFGISPAVANMNLSPPSLPLPPRKPPCRSQLGCVRPIPFGGTFAEVDHCISLADPSFFVSVCAQVYVRLRLWISHFVGVYLACCACILWASSTTDVTRRLRWIRSGNVEEGLFAVRP